MKTLTYTAEQIVKILEQAERPGQTGAAICREYGSAEATFYRWRKTYAGMPLPEVLRLKELEKENSRLKRLLAERMLEIDLLKDLLGKNVTIADRRAAVHVLITGGLSAHRACQLASISRATFRYLAHPEDDTTVIAQMQELAYRYPRYGSRRMTALLRQTQVMNQKRVRRLWRQERLQVRRVRRPRIRRPPLERLQAAYPGHIWAYDFVEDALMDGTPLRLLTVMDEFPREGLAIAVARTTSAERVIGVLSALVAQHGAPAYLRSDNGSEFVATAVQMWLDQCGVQTLSIEPGKPWQNGKEERLNGTVRDECFNLHIFTSVAEACVRLNAYRQEYNTERPHSQLSYLTPLAFKAAWTEAQAKQ